MARPTRHVERKLCLDPRLIRTRGYSLWVVLAQGGQDTIGCIQTEFSKDCACVDVQRIYLMSQAYALRCQANLRILLPLSGRMAGS